MRQRYLSICFFLLAMRLLPAQSGCPGCLVSVPAGLPADTLYLPKLPDGQQGSAYNQDISFRMPKTTTPVHAVDTTTPAGLTITNIEIVSVEGLPPGLHWQPNQFLFEVGNQTDGCIKICGTPAVADSFTLTVRVKAKVFIITKEATFPMHLYIAPKVSTTDGFTMTNFTGCDSTTVDFTNNIPSGGNAGFQYTWDFGDGATFTGENPPPHTYTEPGVYPVHYQVIIDTAGYTLESVTVEAVECVDQLGLGAPDLYLLVDDPDGVNVFDSSPDVNNTPLPYNFPVGLTLGSGNYTLRVVDEDSGAKGGDDDCGTLSFNVLSDGSLVAGGLHVILNIVHPIDTLTATDTVIVYPPPASPVYDIYKNRLRLIDTLHLPPAYSLQWYLNNQPIAGATDFTYCAEIEGLYGLLITDLTTGCSNWYAASVLADPNFDCTTGTHDAARLPFGVFPNPASDATLLRFDQPLNEAGVLRVWDAAGRLVHNQSVAMGTGSIALDCAGWPNGWYLLDVQSGGARGRARLVLVK